jgi:hypothetical protein
MILDPFNAAIHTLQDLRRTAAAPALIRSQRAAEQLGEHAVHVVEVLEAIEHAHMDARVSADVAERLERMDACVLALTALLSALANGPKLKALIWHDEIASRIRVAYTTLEDAIDKLDVRLVSSIDVLAVSPRISVHSQPISHFFISPSTCAT